MPQDTTVEVFRQSALTRTGLPLDTQADLSFNGRIIRPSSFKTQLQASGVQSLDTIFISSRCMLGGSFATNNSSTKIHASSEGMEDKTITDSNLMQQDELKTSHSLLLDVNQSSAFAITSVV